MLRKLGIAALAGALTAPLLVAPVAAVEPAPEGGVDAVAPSAVSAGRSDDGLAEMRVTLPLAVDGRALPLALHDDEAPDDDDHDTADHGHHAERSGLLALPSRPEMLIFEDVPVGAHLAVRSRAGATWTPWTELEASADDAPDGPADPRPGVGPVWIGHGATHVEVASLDGTIAEVAVIGLHVEPEPAGVQGFRAFRSSVLGAVAASSTTPFIRARTDWATSDMGWKCSGSPSVSKDLRAMVVHHTATNTAPYAQADVPSILRGFWSYHVNTRGWCDVAYNFLVDRFGTVWEGRQGGITKAILGGHTYGFNSETTSVAQVGNFQETKPAWAMTASTRQLVGWKLGLHGIDPAGSTTLTNRTGGTMKGVPNGGQVPVSTVPGHRDLGSSACPGDHSYGTLPYVRAQSRTGAHVVALHETFMRALPSPDQYRRWLSTADNDGLRAAAVGMARSEAYSGVIIDDLYQRVLGRAADADGKAYWLGVLASGVRTELVGIHFYGSQEYFDRKGGAEPFVRSLYENLLHREADQKGLDYWVGLLRDGRATPPDVASGFYVSLESRLDRATRAFQGILDRRPSGTEQQHWAQRLLSIDDVVMAIDLSLSDEFYERATS